MAAILMVAAIFLSASDGISDNFGIIHRLISSMDQHFDRIFLPRN